MHLLTFVHLENVGPGKLLFQVEIEAQLFIPVLANHGLMLLLGRLLGGAVEPGALCHILPRLCTHRLTQVSLVCLALNQGGTLPQSLLRLEHALILALVNASVLVVGCRIAEVVQVVRRSSRSQLRRLLCQAFIEGGDISLSDILLLVLRLLYRKLHGVVVDSLVSDSRDALDKLDEDHVHVLRGVNLVDLRLDCQVEQRTDFTSTKVVIADT